MARQSRISGFYRLPLSLRRRAVCEVSGVQMEELLEGLDRGGLDPVMADKIVENVLGTYGLPFGVALNAQINDSDRLIPMVVEEPSVIAAGAAPQGRQLVVTACRRRHSATASLAPACRSGSVSLAQKSCSWRMRASIAPRSCSHGGACVPYPW